MTDAPSLKARLERVVDSDDPFDLQRFVDAQAPIFERALEELRSGHKRSHWMWFIFPQLRGLGRSPMALRFGIDSPAEARAFLAHPVLGERLVLSTECVLAVEGRSHLEIFGTPDDLKFQSSMTLFALASERSDNVFQHALTKYCAGRLDKRTVAQVR